MEEILSVPTDQLIRIGLYVVMLFIIWGAMRMILRITKRVFQFGCLAIFLLGAGLVLLQMFGGY